MCISGSYWWLVVSAYFIIMMAITFNKDVFSISELERYTGISRYTFKKWINLGILEADHYIGAHPRFRMENVDKAKELSKVVRSPKTVSIEPISKGKPVNLKAMRKRLENETKAKNL